MLGLARLGLSVAVGLCPRDALLLAAPGVVVGGVTDVVVDKGVGLLPARVHLVLAVATLLVGGRRYSRQTEGEKGEELARCSYSHISWWQGLEMSRLFKCE